MPSSCQSADAGTWTRSREAIGLLLRGYTARTAAPVACLVGTLSVVNQRTVIAAG